MKNSDLRTTIFLIGFMGSGKSTVGKKLANKLNLNFVDMDRDIESKTNTSIAIIFKEKGESYFRNLEREWLNNDIPNNSVISTGGGTPCFHENLQKMKEKGVVIFLKVKAEILAQRLFNAQSNRPLLAGYQQNKDTLKLFIDQKLNEREHYYHEADIIFDASDFNANKLSDLCLQIQNYKEG